MNSLGYWALCVGPQPRQSEGSSDTTAKREVVAESLIDYHSVNRGSVGSTSMFAKYAWASLFAAILWPFNFNAETVTILCFIPGLPPEINASQPEPHIPSTVKFELDLSNSLATAYN